MEGRTLAYVLAASALVLLAGLGGYAVWATTTAQAHGEGSDETVGYQGWIGMGGMMGEGMMGMGGGMGRGAPGMGGYGDHDEAPFASGRMGGDEHGYMDRGYGEGFMDEWCWEAMGDMGFPMYPDMPFGPISLEEFEATVKEVDVESMIIVVETEDGETITLKALSRYVDMESGAFTFGPWILAQLEPGDDVAVKAVVRGGDRGVALGIGFGGSEYLHPMLAFKELAGGH